jgi:hypothetical protein
MNIIVIRLYAVFVQDELRLRRGVYNRLYVSIKLITAFLNSIVLWQKAKNVKLPCLTILLNNDTCSILCVNAAEILFVLQTFYYVVYFFFVISFKRGCFVEFKHIPRPEQLHVLYASKGYGA